MTRPVWRTERRFESDLSRYAPPADNQSSEGKVTGKVRFPSDNESDSDEDEVPGAYAVTRVSETSPQIDEVWDPTERRYHSPLFDDEPASSNDGLQTTPDSIEDAEIARASRGSVDTSNIKTWRSRRCAFLILFMLIGIWAIGATIGYLSMKGMRG